MEAAALAALVHNYFQMHVLRIWCPDGCTVLWQVVLIDFERLPSILG
jgi:hypothetical protein